MNAAEARQFWDDVAKNDQALKSCPGPHAFLPISPEPGRRYGCSTCGGQVSGQARTWYELGLRHARPAATPVIAGFGQVAG